GDYIDIRGACPDGRVLQTIAHRRPSANDQFPTRVGVVEIPIDSNNRLGALALQEWILVKRVQQSYLRTVESCIHEFDVANLWDLLVAHGRQDIQRIPARPKDP